MSGTTGGSGSGQGDKTIQSRSDDNSNFAGTGLDPFSMGDLLRSLAMIADQQAQQITLLQNLSTYLALI